MNDSQRQRSAGFFAGLGPGYHHWPPDFGKGAGAAKFDLPDGSAIRLTIALHYYLPSGEHSAALR